MLTEYDVHLDHYMNLETTVEIFFLTPFHPWTMALLFDIEQFLSMCVTELRSFWK